MRFRPLSFSGHLLFLALFCAGCITLWLLPALLVGFPHEISPYLLSARNEATTGLFSIQDTLGRFVIPNLLPTLGVPNAEDGRLSTMLFAFFSRFIAWDALLSWSALSAAVAALSLFFFWMTVFFGLPRRIFSRARIAWVSTVILALMPMYFREAVELTLYDFALLFLFASFAAFVILCRHSRTFAILISGLLFGLAVASKDTFLVFIPWYVVVYLWMERAHLRRAVSGIVIFGIASGAMYLLPYVGDISRYGYPVNQNLARLWPGAEEVRDEIYLHLYPDPYTYLFDKERFDHDFLAKVQKLPPLQRMQTQKILVNFGVGSPGFIMKTVDGLWLFLNNLPSLLFQDTVGGIILWLFIVPGLLFLWQKDRRMTLLLCGLFLSSEFIIRFVLHYARDHVMDFGWILALLAGIGVSSISDQFCAAQKKISSVVLSGLVTIVLVLQLLQANRVLFARLYQKSSTPDTIAIAAAMKDLPDDAIVALPLHPTQVLQVAELGNRSIVLFAPETVEQLRNEGKFRDVFRQYGITHILRYSDTQSRVMQRAFPRLRTVSVPEARSLTVTPFLQYLLHKIR